MRSFTFFNNNKKKRFHHFSLSRSHEKVKTAVRLFAASLGYSIVKPLQEEVIVQFVMGHA